MVDLETDGERPVEPGAVSPSRDGRISRQGTLTVRERYLPGRQGSRPMPNEMTP